MIKYKSIVVLICVMLILLCDVVVKYGGRIYKEYVAIGWSLSNNDIESVGGIRIKIPYRWNVFKRTNNTVFLQSIPSVADSAVSSNFYLGFIINKGTPKWYNGTFFPDSFPGIIQHLCVSKNNIFTVSNYTFVGIKYITYNHKDNSTLARWTWINEDLNCTIDCIYSPFVAYEKACYTVFENIIY